MSARAALAEAPSTYVPKLCVGLARTLRSRIAAEHPRVLKLRTELIETIKPRRGFRKYQTQRIADCWTYILPAFGRLALIAEAPSPGRLKIAELRAIPCRMTFDAWDGADELAIAVELLTLILDKGRFAKATKIYADVGLHALARRYERGEDRSDDAVLADLRPLAEGHAQAVTNGGDFVIAGWRGTITQVQGKPVLAVRTFVF